jgi:hypothetical protein
MRDKDKAQILADFTILSLDEQNSRLEKIRLLLENKDEETNQRKWFSGLPRLFVRHEPPLAQ